MPAHAIRLNDQSRSFQYHCQCESNLSNRTWVRLCNVWCKSLSFIHQRFVKEINFNDPSFILKSCFIRWIVSEKLIELECFIICYRNIYNLNRPEHKKHKVLRFDYIPRGVYSVHSWYGSGLEIPIAKTASSKTHLANFAISHKQKQLKCQKINQCEAVLKAKV